ncbi:trypsin-2-like [Onthophagus taurus]|uniref:trypsin-2-like n=1 Tax=Onthophagus taurus TaxID=166361 RepID=UPI0039BE72F2
MNYFNINNFRVQFTQSVVLNIIEPIRIKKVVAHPNYRHVDYNSDICLIKLSKAIETETRGVKITKLISSKAFDKMLLKNECCHATTMTFKNQSYLISNASLDKYRIQCKLTTLMNRKNCTNSLKMKFSETSFCALDTINSNSQIACKTATGAPLFCNGFQIGIASAAEFGCGVPGLYCRVDLFESFIKTTMHEFERSILIPPSIRAQSLSITPRLYNALLLFICILLLY